MKRWLAPLTLATVLSSGITAQDVRPLVVEDVAADSAAARAGVVAGDRWLDYDGRPVPSPAALQALEENAFERTQVAVRLQRGTGPLEITLPRGATGVRVRLALPPDTQTLYEQGRQALAAKDADTAIVRWTAAAKSAGDPGAAAWLHGLAGDLHRDAQRWKPALDAYAAAWSALGGAGDAAARATTLLALGRCSEALSDYPGAEAWFRQAEELNRAAGYEMWMAASIAGRGDAAGGRRDLALARDLHERALSIRERLAPESVETAASLYSLARVQWQSRNLASAQSYADRALALRERLIPESAATASSLSMMGILARERQDLPTAEAFYSRALALRERVGGIGVDLASIINNLGDVARLRGELATAKAYLARALAIHEQVAPDSMAVAIALNNLGSVARMQGDLTAAEDYQKRALVIRQRLAPGSLEVAYGLNNLGNIARDRGDLAAAEDYHRQSLAIKERFVPGSEDVASSYFNLGIVAEARRDFAAAREYHRRALAMREGLTPGSLLVADGLNSLGSISRDLGDLDAAADYLRRALAIREQVNPDALNVAETLEHLSLLSRMQRNQSAARQFATRANGIRERRAPGSLALASNLNLLGTLALDPGGSGPAEALPLFSRAVDIIEARRWEVRTGSARALLLAHNAGAYTGLIRAHLALGDRAAAFAAAESARARSLLESLSESRREIRQGVDPALLATERRLQERINAEALRQGQLLAGRHSPEQAEQARQGLNTLLAEYRELQADIRAKSPRYAELTEPQPVGLADIQREVLDRDTLLLEYVLGDERSHLFAVTASSIDVFDLPPRAEVEQAARRVYDALIARQPRPAEAASLRRSRIEKADADLPAAAAALTRLILDPIAGRLSGQRLLIVADGALQYVPFAALPRPGQPPASKAEPLVVRHEIVNLPSASIVAVMRRERAPRPAPERTVTVVADPVFDPDDARLKRPKPAAAAPPAAAALPADVTRSAQAAGLTDDRGALARLPFSREEADAIVALAPKGGSARAVDFRASRATLTGPEVSRARIVHLATHGLLDAERPELSGIVLSLVDEQGRAQNGFMRLHEIYNLDWSAELVVLSACQTALGQEIRGEGLVGLTRGFMYAGASRVMASLWSVNDSVTAHLMARFYEGLFAGRLSPAAALRAAQIEMWRRQPSQAPYFWAAFMLQGDWK